MASEATDYTSSGWTVKFDRDLRHKAVLAVCNHATDVEDARMLLSMLDLLGDKDPFLALLPVSGIDGNGPGAGAISTLPASGSGAG